MAEATFRVFKTEFANRYIFKSLEELNIELADYVNLYNNVRIHSPLDYLKPVELKGTPLRKLSSLLLTIHIIITETVIEFLFLIIIIPVLSIFVISL